MSETPVAGATERMQALLSRAVEEQVTEQRQASHVLTELREQMAALEAGVRAAASNETVSRLDTAVSTVVQDQRTATTLLGQRLEALTRRVETLSALSDGMATQASAVGEMKEALDRFASFPAALAALQRDVAGMHGRLAPLADVQAAIGDLGSRGAGVEALRPQLDSLEAKIAALGAGGPDRLRDAVVDGLSIRLDRLQQAVERPVVGPEVLRSGLGDLRASITAAVGSQLEPLNEALAAFQERLDSLDARVAAPLASEPAAPSPELTELVARIESLQGLGAQLDTLIGLSRERQQGAESTPAGAALEDLAEDVARISERLTGMPTPTADEVSAQVSMRVADRLVETLAPRIADVVMTRVSATLVNQLAEAIGPQLRAQAEDDIRRVSAESEKRVLAHLDDALLTLAEALLRRKAPKRTAGAPAPLEPLVEEESVQEVVDRLAAPPEVVEPAEEPAPEEPASGEPAAEAAAREAVEPARPAVTTGLAPAPMPASAPPAAVRPAAPLKKAAPRARKQTASAKSVAKVEVKPTKAAVKAQPKPAKAAKRPATRPRPRPLLEDVSDVAPVRPARPRSTQAPRPVVPPQQARPAPAPPAPAPTMPPALPNTVLPQHPAPAPPQRQPEPAKKKWWRSGG